MNKAQSRSVKLSIKVSAVQTLKFKIHDNTIYTCSKRPLTFKFTDKAAVQEMAEEEQVSAPLLYAPTWQEAVLRHCGDSFSQRL